MLYLRKFAVFVMLVVSYFGTAASAAGPTTVDITSFKFQPERIQVAVGGSVTWVNHDQSPHKLTATGGVITSTVLDTNDHVTIKFSHPGTYAYFCVMHPQMTGVVVVK